MTILKPGNYPAAGMLPLVSVAARTKCDHGVPKHRRYTLHSPPNRTQGSNQQFLFLVNSSGLITFRNRIGFISMMIIYIGF